MMPRWAHRLFRNDIESQKLDAELQFHLEQQIAENLEAGMTPQEARRQAQITFGGIEQVKQECRDVHWENFFESIIRDFQFALRSLNKDRRVALTAIFALALGIGACTVVFSAFYNLLFNPFAAKDADRLAVPTIEKSGVELFPLTRSLNVFETIRQQNHTFDEMVAYFHKRVLLDDGHQVRQFSVAYVTPNAFEFYGVHPLQGRGISLEDGKPGLSAVFVMSYKTWVGDFGADPNILGKNFIVDGESRTLVGIMPARFQAYGAENRLWIPIGTDAPSLRPDIFLLGRLKNGVSLNTASADLDVLLRHLTVLHKNDFPEHFTTRVQSAADYFLGAWGIGGSDDSAFNLKHMLYSFLAAGIILLLIACTNVANLLLVRATVREKEIAIRTALGATPGRLVRQLLIESLVLAIAACTAGCAFAFFGVKAVSTMLPQKGIAIGGEAIVSLDWQTLLFTLSITAVITLICGLVPALRVARGNFRPQSSGSSKGVNSDSRHGRLRSIFVIGEVALSIVLLIGAALMVRSLFLIRHIDLGYNPDKLVLAAFGNPKGNHTPEQDDALLQTTIQQLKALPGVSEVAINNSLPGYNGGFESEVVSPATDHLERAKVDTCSESALRTLQMQLARGRWFSQVDVNAAHQVIAINETLARRFFTDQDPIGQRLKVKSFESQSPGNPDFEIIGIVKDIKNQGLQKPVMPEVFVPYRGGGILYLRTEVDPALMMPAIQKQVWSIDKNVIFADFVTAKDMLHTLTYSAPEFGFAALVSLAVLGLLLALIGVFSVIAYTVSLQTHDICIRLALGAQTKDILTMVLMKGLALTLTGIVIGMLVSLGFTRFLASQLWGVSATDPRIFAIVAVGILFAGLAACFLPARRATRVDPVIALRYE